MPISTIGQNGLTVPLTSNTITSASATNLTLQSAGTTAVTIDTSQRVGIGTASPSALLHVSSTSAETLRFQSTSSAPYQTFYNSSANRAGYMEWNTSALKIDAESGASSTMTFLTANNERMRITSGGSLLVNATTGTDFKMRVSGSNAASFGDDYDSTVYGAVQIVRPSNQGTAWHLSFVRGGNQVAGIGFGNNSSTFIVANSGNNGANGMTLGVGATSWGTQSDIRKKNILGYIEDALTKVSTLRTVFFEYKNDEAKKRRVGFIAQDVQTVLPEAVHVDDDEMNTLNLQYSDVIPLLVASIKELKAINDQQAETINALTARIEALENK